MDEDTFWQCIEGCRPSGPDPDAERLAAALTARLSVGSLAGVTGFAEQLSWALYRLDRKEYGNDLSGDCFLYTRAAVVADGRFVYEVVLRNPEAFVLYVSELRWAESLLYVADEVYRHITRGEWARETRYPCESFSNRAGWVAAG